MRIAYCTNVRLPSERAHGHQVAQVCDALANIGFEVTIFAPFRRNPVKEDFGAYYHTRNHIVVRQLGSFDPINRLWLPGVTGLWTLNALLRKNLAEVLEQESFDLLYTRSPALLDTLVASGKPVIVELHQLPRFGRAHFASQCNKCALIACLTTPMRNTLVSWGVSPRKIVVEGDGVDLHLFTNLPSTADAQQKIGVTTNRMVVGYVGRLKTLGMEKGVKYLLEALKQVQGERAFMGLIVGGPEADTKEYKAMAKELGLTADDVVLTGEVPGTQVPTMLAACDILAMPFPDFPHYRNNMSPLKMFEYMAAGKIIVTSDLPTVRDVLREETAYFCTPGDSGSLASVLQAIKNHPVEASTRATAALELSQKYSWEERMKRVLSHVTINL